MAGPLVLPLYMEEWCGIIFKVMGRMGEPETTEKDIGGILICFSVVSEPLGQENTLLKENNMYKKFEIDRKSTRLNSSHITRSRMPSSA